MSILHPFLWYSGSWINSNFLLFVFITLFSVKQEKQCLSYCNNDLVNHAYFIQIVTTVRRLFESLLTLNLLYEVIHLPFLELSIIVFRDINYQDENLRWSTNSIEPGQTARKCRLTWLYTGGNDLSHSVPAG